MNVLRRIMLVLIVIFVVGQTCGAYQFYYADKERKVRLYRTQNIINLAVSTSFKRASNIKTEQDILDLVRKSAATWEKVAGVRFVVEWSEEQSISSYESRGDKINLITIAATPENIAAFQSDGDLNGTTRLFYNKRGQIAETDIALNPLKQFSTDGSFGTFDLESTITHEIGHLLGLDHADALSSTMYPTQAQNGLFSQPFISQRTLAQDDISAIRHLYNTKDGDCCAEFSGSVVPNENVQSTLVWLEDTSDGRLTATLEVDSDGRFSFGGLPKGIYRLWARPNAADSTKYLAQSLTILDLTDVKALSGNYQLIVQNDDNPLSAIGLNAQLSSSSVVFKRGTVATILAASSKQLENDSAPLQFGSSSLIPVGQSFFDRDFNEQTATLTSSFYVGDVIPSGEYTLYRRSLTGGSSALLGAVSIE